MECEHAYIISAGDPEWDEYLTIVEDDPEPPISLFQYAEPWTAKTAVLQFPETPGPRPEVRNADALDSRTKCNRLCEPDLHVFAKLFEDRLERGLEAQTFWA